MKKLALLISIIFIVSCGICSAQTTSFTYQGKLTDGGMLPTAQYDFTFKLFSGVSGGAQIGSDVLVDDVQVTAGIFTVNLNFGSSPFTANTGNYLEFAVRPGASTGTYTTLLPRQPLTSSPYSVQTLRAASAAVADNSLQLGGVAANQFVQTADTRLSDDRNPLPNSANYLQNNPATQQTANFNINGDGAANTFTAATQYNLGLNRVLTVNGLGNSNTFLGVQAGNTNPSGNFNSFFGNGSGKIMTTGGNNSFYGSGSGNSNQTGTDNAFFGRNAGFGSTASQNSFFGSFSGTASSNTASGNSFFGYQSGRANTTGAANSFFGKDSGLTTTTGGNNSFFGTVSGDANVDGSDNSFFGQNAGGGNTSGSRNTFVGVSSGLFSQASSDNSFFGVGAGSNNGNGGGNTYIGVDSGTPVTLGISNSTAIGFRASVTQNNSLVLGSINGINGATADTSVGIGTTAPKSKLQVAGGNVYIANPNSLIITSPNGACWFITVNNAGALSTISVACP